MAEVGTAYAEARERVCELVRSLSDAEAETPVPACPGWTVRDTVAHLTGVCADILAGNVAGAATDEWTAAQLEGRRGQSLGTILDEWSEVGPAVEAIAAAFPGYTGPQWVFDMTTHEHDIRGALGRPGARDSAGVAVSLDFLLSVGLSVTAAANGLGPLEIRAGDRTAVVGGEPTADFDTMVTDALIGGTTPPPPDQPPVGTLRVEPFELLRGFTGRRSPAQVRAWDWSVDPDPYLVMLDAGPFKARPDDLIE